MTAVAVIAAGCGSSSGSKSTAVTTGAVADRPAFTTKQVMDTFKAKTGKSLALVSASSTKALDYLRFGDPDPTGEWGSFSLFVAKKDPSNPKGDVTGTSLLNDDKGHKMTPDQNGVYWQRHTVSADKSANHKAYSYWSATRVYGANVIFVWTGGAQKAYAPSFSRVDQVLSSLGS